MSTQQILEHLISNAPEDKLNIILAFTKFVLLEDTDINNSFLSEASLAKDWMSKDEDVAWENL